MVKGVLCTEIRRGLGATKIAEEILQFSACASCPAMTCMERDQSNTYMASEAPCDGTD